MHTGALLLYLGIHWIDVDLYLFSPLEGENPVSCPGNTRNEGSVTDRQPAWFHPRQNPSELDLRRGLDLFLELEVFQLGQAGHVADEF